MFSCSIVGSNCVCKHLEICDNDPSLSSAMFDLWKSSNTFELNSSNDSAWLRILFGNRMVRTSIIWLSKRTTAWISRMSDSIPVIAIRSSKVWRVISRRLRYAIYRRSNTNRAALEHELSIVTEIPASNHKRIMVVAKKRILMKKKKHIGILRNRLVKRSRTKHEQKLCLNTALSFAPMQIW